MSMGGGRPCASRCGQQRTGTNSEHHKKKSPRARNLSCMRSLHSPSRRESAEPLIVAVGRGGVRQRAASLPARNRSRCERTPREMVVQTCSGNPLGSVDSTRCSAASAPCTIAASWSSASRAPVCEASWTQWRYAIRFSSRCGLVPRTAIASFTFCCAH